MRLKQHQVEIIRQVVTSLAGNDAKVSLFGSRVDDNAHGGDIDLLVEIPRAVEEPAWLSARIAGSISRKLDGQKVDVVLLAPNLKRFPIMDIAKKEGIAL
jgi:predicted nucleotidyltransferase